MSGSLDDFISGFIGSQDSNALTGINESERDGNADDLLLRFEQSANAISVSGGTTLTSISPQAALGDLNQGKLTGRLILWLVLVAVGVWYISKQK